MVYETDPAVLSIQYRLNVEIIDQVLDWLKREHDGRATVDEPAWEQAIWYKDTALASDPELGNPATDSSSPNECKTACCVAGYINLQQGVTKIIRPATRSYSATRGPHTDLILGRENHLGYTFTDWAEKHGWCYYAGGPEDEDWGSKIVAWDDAAQFFLGITPAEACDLFSSSNYYEDIQRIVGELKEKYGA